MENEEPLPVSKSLFEFLVSKREELIEIWMKNVREDERIESADELSRYVLRDHMPEILMQIILALGRHKSGVLSPEEAARMVGKSDASKAHAGMRFINGYTLEEALRELSHLRAASIELWHAESAQLSIQEFAVFHACVDDLMITATNEISSRMNVAKDVFLGRLSHEISLPLTEVATEISLTIEKEQNDEGILRPLENIRRHLNLLTATIENLKDLSKIIFGRLKLNLNPCDLESVVTAGFETIRAEADRKNISIDLQVESDTPSFLADGLKLQQCLTNILGNAVKFAANGGSVLLRANRDPKFVTFEVVDDGQGMAAEFIPLAFEQFRQEADPAHTRGLGLGLAVARELVELHGGHISATSTGKSKGTTVRIVIPARKALLN